MTETPICNPTLKHDPHEMKRGPHKGKICAGVTAHDVRIYQIRKQEAIKTEAHRFATQYGIHVSPRSLRANPEVWREVQRALDRQYDKGLQAGKVER